MSLKNTPFYSSALDYAIDRHPLIVAAQTPVSEVITLMSQVRSACPLPNAHSGVEEAILPEIRASCVLVREGASVPMCCQLQDTLATEIQGIFTERDIVRLTAKDIDLKSITVGDVMTKALITLRHPDDHGIFTALSLFRQHRIRHLPVVDNQARILGVVTPETVRQALQPANILTHLRSVKDVMSQSVIHARRQTSVLNLAKLMAENRVSCVVITDVIIDVNNSYTKEIIKPVGIVTERDIVQFQALDLDLAGMKAQDVMSCPLFCLSLTDSLWYAHQEMQHRHVRRMVVTDAESHLLGIVSQTSLLQALDPNEMYGIIEVLQQVVDERTKELKTANEQLQNEIVERRRAEYALQQAHDDLQKQVEERTAELKAANDMLVQDIAERKRVEIALRQSEAQLRRQAQQLTQALHELQQTQSQLIQAEKMSSLGQLVAGIAHEINNPVNFIYGNLSYASQYIEDLLALLENYQKTYPDGTQEINQQAEDIDLNFLVVDLPKLLNSMQIGAERIRQIVVSLRNFSRLDEAEKKKVDLHEGIDSTLLILDHRVKGKGKNPPIKIIKNYGFLPPVECYAGTLNQVFMNILSNAIDALESDSMLKETKAEKTITIQTEITSANWVGVRISDNGMGMPAHVQQHLFEPFFTTKPVGKGTGLGLSISYQIVVEKHGGRLHCNSKPGEGTEFLIEIPIKQKKHKPEFL